VLAVYVDFPHVNELLTYVVRERPREEWAAILNFQKYMHPGSAG
jgi:hypothetical protein